MNIKLLGKIDKLYEEDRIIAGYASVAIIDCDNQYISSKVLSDGIKPLFEDEGIYSNLMLSHSNTQIGNIL